MPDLMHSRTVDIASGALEHVGREFRMQTILADEVKPFNEFPVRGVLLENWNGKSRQQMKRRRKGGTRKSIRERKS